MWVLIVVGVSILAVGIEVRYTWRTFSGPCPLWVRSQS